MRGGFRCGSAESRCRLPGFEVQGSCAQRYNPSLRTKEFPMKRPEPTEYAEFYANYISRVPGTDVLGVLESQRLQMLQLFAGRSERDGSFRYAPGKWTVKEVLGHITDTERILRTGHCGLRAATKRCFPDSSRMTTCAVADLASGHSRAWPRSLEP